MIRKESLSRATLLLAAVAIVAMSWLAPLDIPAMERVDAGMKRALVSFASARILNGAISFAQGTAVSATPFGVGVTLTPGQLLAPAHDLVKHFSDLMLAAAVAFGIQKLLITIGGYWLVSLTLTIVIAIWLGLRWQNRPPLPWLSRILLVLLMIRFAIPLVTLGTDLLTQKFLTDEYQASQKALELSSREGAAMNPAAPPSADGNVLQRMKDWVERNADVKARVDRLIQSVGTTTDHIVKLMAIFMLQTLVIPLVLLWVMYTTVLRGLTTQRPAVATPRSERAPKLGSDLT